jgi:hypothetical protein
MSEIFELQTVEMKCPKCSCAAVGHGRSLWKMVPSLKEQLVIFEKYVCINSECGTQFLIKEILYNE